MLGSNMSYYRAIRYKYGLVAIQWHPYQIYYIKTSPPIGGAKLPVLSRTDETFIKVTVGVLHVIVVYNPQCGGAMVNGVGAKVTMGALMYTGVVF